MIHSALDGKYGERRLASLERRQVLCIIRGCEYSFSVQAKVADFGLLKSVPSGEELADQGKGVAGTPGYIINPPLPRATMGGIEGLGYRVQGSGCKDFGLRSRGCGEWEHIYVDIYIYIYIHTNMIILRERRKRYGVVSLFSIMRGKGEKAGTEGSRFC